MIFLRFRTVFFLLLLPLSFLLGANQCGREDIDGLPQPETGTLTVQFRHTFGNDSLMLGSTLYIIPAGDTITFRSLGYYISNIKFIDSRTGNVFSEPGSYHIISPSGNRTNFTIAGIPAGNFDRIEFSVGVDEPINTAGEKIGDLGNILGWNSFTGYDFFVFDGSRLNGSGTKNYDLLFKVNGAQNYKTLTFNLPQDLVYQQTETYKMDVGVDLENLFRNPHLISFGISDIVEGKVNPQKLADNYAAGMFRISRISR